MTETSRTAMGLISSNQTTLDLGGCYQAKLATIVLPNRARIPALDTL